MAGGYATRMKKIVRENNPEWNPGDVLDTSFLDQLGGTLGRGRLQNVGMLQ